MICMEKISEVNIQLFLMIKHNESQELVGSEFTVSALAPVSFVCYLKA